MFGNGYHLQALRWQAPVRAKCLPFQAEIDRVRELHGQDAVIVREHEGYFVQARSLPGLLFLGMTLDAVAVALGVNNG